MGYLWFKKPKVLKFWNVVIRIASLGMIIPTTNRFCSAFDRWNRYCDIRKAAGITHKSIMTRVVTVSENEFQYAPNIFSFSMFV